MRIDQRNAGASYTPTTSAPYTVDRFYCNISQASKLTAQQNAGAVTPPSGFVNYLGVTSSSAYSVLSGDYFGIVQGIEGFNTADLAWGTANAQTVTLSFWVRSSLTGSHSGAVYNIALNRSYVFPFTVSAANTWEYKTVTIPGDTSGTWLTNNGQGIGLSFNLGTGSTFTGASGAWNASLRLAATGAVSVVGTNGATFQITGVQLEAGSVATPLERRPYGTELALCQRYYGRFLGTGSGSQPSFGTGLAVSTSSGAITIQFPQTMRASPTLSASQLAISDSTTYDSNVSSISAQLSGTNSSRATFSTSGGMTQYRPGLLIAQSGTSGYIDFSAEL